ncbi:MAG: ATP-dependent endonuclease [Thaumarchaeota archaeon]|nr:ATP-dependent endonuclease [Nitrososphaerota archaeon]
MRVKSVSIKNYRSLRNVTVKLDGLTVLIGPNGAGKTSVLRALELFSDAAPPVTMDDFNRKKRSVKVDLVVSCAASSGRLAPYAINGKIRLRREYIPPGGLAKSKSKSKPKAKAKVSSKPTQKDYVRTRFNSDFDGIRDMTKKTDIKPAIATLKKQEAYADIPECEGTAAEWRPKFSAYERGFCAKRPNHATVKIGYVELDIEPILKQVLEVVYVPAMRDITHDASDGSGSYLSKLVSLAIDYAQDADSVIGEASSKSDSAYREYFGLIEGRLVPRLNADLNEISCRFEKDTHVTIGLNPDNVLPRLHPSITLSEDGREADIGHVGGGLQRIYLMALLEAIADQREGAKASSPSSRARLVMIDEPEIYQHPQRQRHILHGFLGLVGGRRKIQMLCGTHSPYFIELSRIGGLRLLRKKKATGVSSTTQKEIMPHIVGTYSGRLPKKTVLNRWLDMNASHWITEGFFARLAVLVEGMDDRNVLLATASVLGVDFSAHGISIIPANGKPKIYPVAHLFRPFKIPLYLVWDLDCGGDREEDQRILGLADPAWLGRHGIPKKTTTCRKFSCIEPNMTARLHEEIDGCKSALKKVGGWKALLGGDAVKAKKLKHCDSCKCERVEATEGIKQVLGTRDAVYDILLGMREADEGAFDSLTPVKIVHRLVEAAHATNPAAEKGSARECAGGGG